MARPTLNQAPTEYQELRLLETIYMSPEDTDRRLDEFGYAKLIDLDVPNVKCFLYAPKALPPSRPETVAFDFARHAQGRVTVGVCIGGTTVLDGWDAKFELLIQGLVKATADYHRANTACSQILEALDSLKETYPELSEHEISFNVHIAGYSLGGLFAQATTVLLMNDWARANRHKITCRTYDCPGVQDHYHQMARNRFNGRSAPWKNIITNYKSMPGPLNTVFKDIGRVIHLYNPEKITCDATWITSCISGTAMRASFWASMAQAFSGEESEKKSNQKDKKSKKHDAKALNGVVTKASQGLALLVKVGLDVADVKHYHDLSTMLECFDENGAFLPGVRIEMAQWPVYEQFKDEAVKMLKRSASAMVPFSEDNAGLHTLFFLGGKRGFIERKLANLPGYQPSATR